MKGCRTELAPPAQAENDHWSFRADWIRQMCLECARAGEQQAPVHVENRYFATRKGWRGRGFNDRRSSSAIWVNLALSGLWLAALVVWQFLGLKSPAGTIIDATPALLGLWYFLTSKTICRRVNVFLPDRPNQRLLIDPNPRPSRHSIRRRRTHGPSGLKAVAGTASPTSAPRSAPPRKRAPRRHRGRHGQDAECRRSDPRLWLSPNGESSRQRRRGAPGPGGSRQTLWRGQRRLGR
jgi:hypothetical protein